MRASAASAYAGIRRVGVPMSNRDQPRPANALAPGPAHQPPATGHRVTSGAFGALTG
ncbi:hypothetical protein [Streptomyces iranensis]|uniref:hypothetical protein n=1 Tax=Streptomyces iranensis TaxID=576784 RepID=UPI0039B77BA4